MSYENIPFLYILRRNIKLISVVFICFGLPVLAYIRYYKPPFKAQIKLYAKSGSQSSLLSSGPSLSGLFSDDQEKFLYSQEALLKSYRVYQYVEDRTNQVVKVAKPSSMSRALRRAFLSVQAIFFGKQYLIEKNRWRDRGYENFITRTGLDVDLGTGSITLMYTHEKPKAALKITKTISEALIDINLNIVQAQSKETAEFLKKKVRESTARVEETSHRAALFMKRNQISDNDKIVEEQFVRFQQSELEVERVTAELIKQKVLARYDDQFAASLREEIQQAKKSGRLAPSSEISHKIRAYQAALESSEDLAAETVSGLQREVSSLNAQLEKLVANKEPDLTILSLEGLLTENRGIKAHREANIKSLEHTVGYIQGIVDKSKRKFAKFPELNVELGKFLFKLKKEKKILEVLTEKFLIASIASDSRVGKLFVISEPRIINSFKVGKFRILLSSLFILLMAIVTFVVGKSILAGVILSSQQLKKHEAIRYLGAVPHFKTNPLIQTMNSGAIDESIITVTQGLHLACRGNKDKPSKIVSFCSVTSGSGKSVTSALLTYSLASRGLKVALIDCDFRAGESGISSLLYNMNPNLRIKSMSAIHQTSSAGNIDGNSGSEINIYQAFQGLQSRDQFHQYLENQFVADLTKLSNDVDYILVDCPPVYFADTLSIINKSENVVYCIPEGRVNLAELNNTIQTIVQNKAEDAQILGILTDCSIEENLASSGERYSYYRNHNKRAA